MRFGEYGPAQFAGQIASELRDGIAGTDVRRGHIKLAVTDLSAAQESALRGGARAGAETGALVTVHPGFEPHTDGRRIVDILTEEGLPSDQIVIAHAGRIHCHHQSEDADPGTCKLGNESRLPP